MQVTSNDVLLVTGATGLVGSHVAEQAVQRGWRVRTGQTKCGHEFSAWTEGGTGSR